jgi:hypothetical protein
MSRATRDARAQVRPGFRRIYDKIGDVLDRRARVEEAGQQPPITWETLLAHFAKLPPAAQRPTHEENKAAWVARIRQVDCPGPADMTDAEIRTLLEQSPQVLTLYPAMVTDYDVRSILAWLTKLDD